MASRETRKPAVSSGSIRADGRTRTGDPFITRARRCPARAENARLRRRAAPRQSPAEPHRTRVLPQNAPVAVGVAAIALAPWRDLRARSARADIMTTNTDVGGRPRTAAIRQPGTHSRRFAGWPTASAITSTSLTRSAQRSRKRISASEVRPSAAQPRDRPPVLAADKVILARHRHRRSGRSSRGPASRRRRAAAEDRRRARRTARFDEIGESVTAADDKITRSTGPRGGTPTASTRRATCAARDDPTLWAGGDSAQFPQKRRFGDSVGGRLRRGSRPR